MRPCGDNLTSDFCAEKKQKKGKWPEFKEKYYNELGQQYGYLFDLNHEGVGLNKRTGESYQEYVNRLAANRLRESHDFAIQEFVP